MSVPGHIALRAFLALDKADGFRVDRGMKLGDGAALYGIQGLWTAARYRIPVTFVIANNRQYKILKATADVLGLPGVSTRPTPGLDLVGPEVDFVGLARSLGVEARRVADPDELSELLRQALAGDAPRLFDVPIAG